MPASSFENSPQGQEALRRKTRLLSDIQDKEKVCALEQIFRETARQINAATNTAEIRATLMETLRAIQKLMADADQRGVNRANEAFNAFGAAAMEWMSAVVTPRPNL